VTYRFRLSAKNKCPSTNRFVFGRKWNFIFVGFFVVYGRKRKMLFGRPLVYITKRSFTKRPKRPKRSHIGLEMQSLGLGLEKF